MAFNFRKLFIKEDEEVKETPKVEQPKVNTPVVNNTAWSSQGAPVIIQSQNDYTKHFDDVIKNAPNISSPGYREFVQALEKMNGKPYTDQQKYENIYSVFEIQGCNTDKLISTANQAIAHCESERSEFDLSYRSTEETDVKAKQTQMEKLRAENEELTKKLQENNKRLEELNNEVIESTQTLTAEKSAFENALITRVGIINDHINKIKLYLNATVSK